LSPSSVSLGGKDSVFPAPPLPGIFGTPRAFVPARQVFRLKATIKTVIDLSNRRPYEGCPIVYGLTIPKGAPHEEAAVEFLGYFLDTKGGLAILEEMGQATVGPRPMKEDDPIPEELKPLMKAK